MFGIINSTLRIASRSDSAPNAADQRDKHGRGYSTSANGQPVKLRFRSQADAESWAKKL